MYITTVYNTQTKSLSVYHNNRLVESSCDPTLYEGFIDIAEAKTKYSHIDFKPTEAMAAAARRGLELRAEQPESNRCCTQVGLARARDLSNRKTLSPSTVRRMLSFFQRHEVDKKGEGWGKDSKGYQAWLIWGGDPGFSWARARVKQMEAADNK